MKTRTFILVGVLTILWVGKASAVWPPETSLHPEEESSALRNASLRKARPVSDRIDEDTRRLEEVLRDLKEDQKDLKQQVTIGQDASKFHDLTNLSGGPR